MAEVEKKTRVGKAEKMVVELEGTIAKQIEALEKKIVVPQTESPAINIDEIVEKVMESLSKKFEYVADRLQIVEMLISDVSKIKIELANIKSIDSRKAGETVNEFFGAPDDQTVDPIFQYAGKPPIGQNGLEIKPAHPQPIKLETVFQVP
jgi:hypothetical protein